MQNCRIEVTGITGFPTVNCSEDKLLDELSKIHSRIRARVSTVDKSKVAIVNTYVNGTRTSWHRITHKANG